MVNLNFVPLPRRADPPREPLSKGRKALIGVVIAGAVVIASIGFAGSYDAVSKLALAKGFGWFAYGFPIGIDAGIVVFLALDLVLAGFRMQFALLRPFAWFLTVATIAFNASAAWGDWIAVGMHGVIPLLFVVLTEAARFAVGRLADIHSGNLIESPPFIRWLIAPVSTFRIWRTMRLWRLTSYEEVITRQRELAAFRTKLRALHGRRYRSKITDAESLALRLARFGTPVAEALAQCEAEAEAARKAEAVRREEDRRQAEAEAELRVQADAKQLAEAEAKRLAEIASRQRIEEAEAAADQATSEAKRRAAEANPKPETAPEVDAEASARKPNQRPEVGRTAKPKPEPKPAAKPKPAELNGRRAQVEAEVEAVLNLIKTEGWDAVSLERVKEDFGLKHGAGFDRLKKARERFQDEQTKGTSPERRAE